MTDLNITGKARGEFKLIVTRENGNVEEATFPNMLLDNAFAASSRQIANCTVGSGTTPPIGTNTQLQNRLGTNISGDASTVELDTVFTGSVATVARKSTMVFAVGAIVGNVSELALYTTTTISSANIVVRSLVTDVNGDPTTITLGSSDQLTVEHTLFVDIETRPAPTVMTINSVNYTVSVVVGWPEFFLPGVRTDFDASNLPGLKSTINTFRAAENVSVSSAGAKVRPTYSGASFAVGLTLTNNISTPTLGKKTVTASASIPTSTQLTGGVPIAGCLFGSTASTLNIAVLFDPPLPKNSTVGYTFNLTATLQRV